MSKSLAGGRKLTTLDGRLVTLFRTRFLFLIHLLGQIACVNHGPLSITAQDCVTNMGNPTGYLISVKKIFHCLRISLVSFRKFFAFSVPVEQVCLTDDVMQRSPYKSKNSQVTQIIVILSPQCPSSKAKTCLKEGLSTAMSKF